MLSVIERATRRRVGAPPHERPSLASRWIRTLERAWSHLATALGLNRTSAGT
jgi:hypothetical protein